MFWRRKKSDANGLSGSSRGGKQQNEDSSDDIAKLQRQFGIKPVSDAEVQAEFQKLFGAGGAGAGAASATGLSPRSELLLFGGAGGTEDDDEANILRALNIKGTSVDKLDIDGLDLSDDDEDDGGGDQDAKHELKGVLREVHTTAVHYQSQNDPLQIYTGTQTRIETRAGTVAAGGNNQEDVAARVQELKRQAIMLKREGKVKEALALFRQAKELEAAPVPSVSGGGPTTRAQPPQAPVVESVQHDDDDDDDDDGDIEVTDEDMQDPEFLAQLAKMGLHGDTQQQQKSRLPIETIASVEAQIQDAKQQAVERKRNNQIQEALQWMRRIKELEGTLARLREEEGEDATHVSSRSNVLTTVTTSANAANQSAVVAQTEETTTMKRASADRVVTAHSYTSAAVSMNDEDDEGNLLDVEVTENDMDDSAFAEELRKLGFNPSNGDDKASNGGRDSSAAPTTNSNAIAQRLSATASAYDSAPAFRSGLSIGDEDLIDEFDEEEDNDSGAPLSYSSSSTTAATVGYGSLSTTQVAVAPVICSPSPSPEQQQPTQQEQVDLTDLENQLQHAKETAIRLKREGSIKEALETMRRVKQIETLIEHKKQRKYVSQLSFALPPPFIQQDPVTAAKFHELEQLLVDFGNHALALAKENLSVDRAKATEWLNKRKEYAGELDKLRAKRQNPLQLPPPFKVEKISREVEVELTDIPTDQVVVNIHSVSDLRAMAGRDIFVKFCLNFPAATPHEGKTGTLRVSSNAPYSTGKIAQQSQFRFPVQRSRGTQRLMEIKKAHFEVWTAGTFLRSPELVARGYQELAPFLSTCQMNCCVPFVGSNRKPTGGNVEVSIRFRTPLKDKEMKVETTEELRVGEYPEPSPPSVTPAATFTSSSTSASFAEVVKSDLPNAPPSTEPPVPDELEADDPHHPDLIISYDVINEELEKIEAKLPSLQGQAAIDLSDRFDSLSLKKQLLEIDMETGKLTLDMYVEKLHARIKEDRQLIAKLMKSGRRMDAARVLHRVKIMEKELVVGDEESSEGVSAT